MKLHEVAPSRFLAEAVDPHQFGTITHGPEWYLHYTHTDDNIRSIMQRGFDLSMSGYTAKKFNSHEWAKNDPAGVFATEFEGIEHVDKWRPFVIFQMQPLPNVLTKPTSLKGESDNLKDQLAHAYNCRGKKLSNILLKANIQVVHSIFEFIILDPSRIRVVETSLSLKEAGLL